MTTINKLSCNKCDSFLDLEDCIHIILIKILENAWLKVLSSMVCDVTLDTTLHYCTQFYLVYAWLS